MDLDDEFIKHFNRKKQFRNRKISFVFKEILNGLRSKNSSLQKKLRKMEIKKTVETKEEKKQDEKKKNGSIDFSLEREIWVCETLNAKKSQLQNDIKLKHLQTNSLLREKDYFHKILNSNNIINVQSKIHDKLKKAEIVQDKLKLDDYSVNMKFAINMGRVDLKHAKTAKNKKRKKVLELREKIKTAENNIRFQKMEIDAVDKLTDKIKKRYEVVKASSIEYEQFVKLAMFFDKNNWVFMDTKEFVTKLTNRLQAPLNSCNYMQSLARVGVQKSTLNLFNMARNDYMKTVESSTFEISNKLKTRILNKKQVDSVFKKLPTIEHSINLDESSKASLDNEKNAPKMSLCKFKISLSNIVKNKKKTINNENNPPQKSFAIIEDAVMENNKREVFFYKKKLTVIFKQHSKILKFIKQHETMADSINEDIKRKQNELNHFKSELEELKEKGSKIVKKYEPKANIQLLKETLLILTNKNKKTIVKEKGSLSQLYGHVFELENTYNKFRINYLKILRVVSLCDYYISNALKLPSPKSVQKDLIRSIEGVKSDLEELVKHQIDRNTFAEGCLADQFGFVMDRLLLFKDKEQLIPIINNIYDQLLLVYKLKLGYIQRNFKKTRDHLTIGVIIKQKEKVPVTIKASDRRKAIMVNSAFDMNKIKNEFSPTGRNGSIGKNKKREFSKLIHNSPIYKHSKLLMERCLNLKAKTRQIGKRISEMKNCSGRNILKITHYKTQLDNIHKNCRFIS